MKYFSMFSGIGGFELGIKNRGDCIGYSEIDKASIRTYEKNFGKEVKNYGDATEINPETIPDFDLLVGGFPCQAFSIAGARRGFEDTRGTLFFEIARIIKRKLPKMFLLENVKGLLNHNGGNTFTTILQTIDELGYDAEWQVLNSKHFGVPQNRERVFIIGYLRGTSRRQIFPIRESGVASIQTIFPNIPEIGEGHRVYKDTGISPSVKGTIQIAIKDKFQKTVYDTTGISPTVREGHGDVIRIYDGYNRKYTKEIGAIRQNMLNGGSLIQLNNPEHSTDRLYDPKGIARTLRSNAGGCGAKTGAYKTTHGIRKLTPIECERLQGFPDNWTKGVSDAQRYKQLGNAVTVNVIEKIIIEEQL